MTEAAIRGWTLPALLSDACQHHHNSQAFHQLSGSDWQSYSTQDLQVTAQELAVGLWELGLAPGDRVGLLLFSDVFFLAADMGSQVANLVNVPIDLSQTLENIIYSLHHSRSRILFVANRSLLNQVAPYLCHVDSLQAIILAEVEDPEDIEQHPRPTRDDLLHLPIPETRGLDLSEVPYQDMPHCTLPFQVRVLNWSQLRTLGRDAMAAQPEVLAALEAGRSPQQLATIIYIPGEEGQLKGVMLTQENLTSAALASFSGMTRLKWGDKESVVTFLPLTHIFARTMLYGHLYYGHRVYFSNPQRVMRHLQDLRPTILSTVPLLLHRIYRKLRSTVDQPLPEVLIPTSTAPVWSKLKALQKSLSVHSIQHRLSRYIQRWAFAVASRYRLGQSSPRWPRAMLERGLAELIYFQWRRILGGRLRYCLSGGASLQGEVANFFAAIGTPVLQGYGLTQTSAAVTFNRQRHNRANTVGQPALGVDCTIAADGEILVRGPTVTPGYFQAPETTALEIDDQGWFHTGDLGYFNAEGYLVLTGMKKSLFKLSTGKYVTPLPLEAKLQESELIDEAVIVGHERKFCGALLFVHDPTLLALANTMAGMKNLPMSALLENPCMVGLFQALVNAANCHLPYWSTIRKFELIPASQKPAALRRFSHRLRRQRLLHHFAREIEQLYQDPAHPSRPRRSKRERESARLEEPGCPNIPVVTCPVTAQSLKAGYS
ncbi:AMP-dependent synthetase/ligase [Lyngbya confervoides]|uniref:AMP-binding protein n=1 Tax=Lyngbya confervoides BDU141951 TaxID=1574623 RepID=A0ABD4T5I7_9CYAN|nr:AMP-binding protein [Lyngbya confervoides]MCM1984051.1 AMP-binding protein [Lyngbya confervoides BDU141951]